MLFRGHNIYLINLSDKRGAIGTDDRAMNRVVKSLVSEPATLEEVKKAWLGIKI